MYHCTDLTATDGYSSHGWCVSALACWRVGVCHCTDLVQAARRTGNENCHSHQRPCDPVSISVHLCHSLPRRAAVYSYIPGTEQRGHPDVNVFVDITGKKAGGHISGTAASATTSSIHTGTIKNGQSISRSVRVQQTGPHRIRSEYSPQQPREMRWKPTRQLFTTVCTAL